MSRALVGLLMLIGSAALAQVDGGVSAPSLITSDSEALRRDFDAKLEAARREVKELREEMKAQLASQSTAQGWQEDWVDEKRKLELVTFDGYFRTRPELFYKFNFWGQNSAGVPVTDPSGYTLWPTSPTSNQERTNAGVNMRFRLEPTINVSEEVRIRSQIDMLDNVVWGSTPNYAYSRNASNNYAYDTNNFSLFSNSQAPVTAGVNSLTNSIALKRVWGEISTPVGMLRFGRMGSHWGLGMLYNDGNGIDSDWGDTVDRVSFTAEPIPGWYFTPMLDFNVEGPLSVRQASGGQQFDLSNSDDVHSFIIAIARKDTETERRAKLDSGGFVFNFGLHFTYKVQRNDAVDLLSQPFGTTDGQSPTAQSVSWVQRQGSLFTPDVWVKFERKNLRIEGEFAAILGSIQNRALTGSTATSPGFDQSLYVYQFGGVLQGEYRILNGDLEFGVDVGVASGDKAPGYGYYPRRKNSSPTQPGDIDGAQYNCPSTGGCLDNQITNFRMNQDFRVDMILYREILGGITDSIYVKPRVKYRIIQGFEAFVSGIYSRSLFWESTPGSLYASAANGDPSLGIELNAGARYETEDGFFGQLQYGILFPLGGFHRVDANGNGINSDNPQALRAVVGIKF
jgi:uncharacterized protein (TIGR04551 family)